MPVLERLSITRLRNIAEADIRLHPAVNLFYGANGSGKTSMLEAIHLLGLARSFRSSSATPIIQHEHNECAVYGKLTDGTTLGYSRNRQGSQLIKIDGKQAGNSAELAERLPLQLLNTETFRILEGSPATRRGFLDWGVFHVEHRFLEHWRHAQRALKNRNALLKGDRAEEEIRPWTSELCRHAEEIDRMRGEYLGKLAPVLEEILGELLPVRDLRIEYERGWNAGETLDQVLSSGIQRDRKYGYTVAGPHRAELKIKLGSAMAVDVLSRGQQKLFVAALKIAQGFLLETDKEKPCLYLLDDLAAELDATNKQLIYGLLSRLNSQVMITGIEREPLIEGFPEGARGRLFHVKHGKIESISD